VAGYAPATRWAGASAAPVLPALVLPRSWALPPPRRAELYGFGSPLLGYGLPIEGRAGKCPLGPRLAGALASGESVR
jgi:hypothetical protein